MIMKLEYCVWSTHESLLETTAKIHLTGSSAGSFFCRQAVCGVLAAWLCSVYSAPPSATTAV